MNAVIHGEKRSGIEGFVVAACLVIGVIGVVGCGKSDGLTAVSGRVTWKGKPVPRGNVSIEPDAARGNTGPQCRSSIIDGAFESRPRFGAVQGPVVVIVEGTHTPPGGEFAVPLFPRYTFTTEIPADRATLEIVVPDDPSAKPKAR